MNSILIIAGPSAVGKTTLAHALLKEDEKFELVRSVTSRPPRGDSFDREYIYLQNEELKQLIDNGGVLEHTEYAGALYGTPKSEIERILSAGKTPLLILDLDGVHSVVNAKNDFKACALYITAPMELLDKRLSERYGADTEKRDSRMAKNRADFLRLEEIKQDFYRFTENSGNAAESVAQIKKAFADFCSK